MSVTTRHSCSLYPWQVGSPLPAEGPLIGLDLLAGGTVFHYDPWVLYGRRLLTSPNMVVLGQLGKGKSSLVKTHLHRQLLAGRQAFVLDPKGEYAGLAALHQMPRLRLGPGSPDRLNPLDPHPQDNAADVARRRTTTCTALAATGLGRDLTPEERAALAATCARLTPTALLADVVDALLQPDRATASELHCDAAGLAGRIRPLALELRRILHGDLAGMLDAPTTCRLDPHGPGLVLDLSAVFTTPALPTVMVAAGAWLSRALTPTTGTTPTSAATSPSTAAGDGERRRLLLVDEAWSLLHLPATTAWLQALSKLARAHGVQLITVLHRPSDLTGQADHGTATQARAAGLLADAETRVLYAQTPGERTALAELLDLTAVELDLVTALPPHRALWHVGPYRAVIEHLLSTVEAEQLIDTDQHMNALTHGSASSASSGDTRPAEPVVRTAKTSVPRCPAAASAEAVTA
ncbi:MAG: hypothetical protein Q8R60_14965 [Mycobacteriales bacterium]|nr:hypothetical protein [Mycobacteriales bacterium]